VQLFLKIQITENQLIVIFIVQKINFSIGLGRAGVGLKSQGPANLPALEADSKCSVVYLTMVILPV
jgi:hypothetical protein